jgi:hypothetical protein
MQNYIPINNESGITETKYGSNGTSNNITTDTTRSTFISFLDYRSSNDKSDDDDDDDEKLHNIFENEDEDEDLLLLQSNREIQFISNEEKCGIELRKIASYSLDERREVGNQGFIHCISAFMLKLYLIFAYFDAGQSFYEITRMTWEDPYVDSLHQQRLRKAGETSLDPSNSTLGLFPMYISLTSVKKGKKKSYDPDQTVSVSSSKCLNGLKSISMLWIIFGHTLAVQSSVGYINHHHYSSSIVAIIIHQHP